MSGRRSRTAAAAESGGTVAPSKSQRAYRLLHDRIVDGTYSPGFRLVLDAIGRELDMSVVPVREAIRRLEAEGLVTFERNIGARVAEIDELEYHDTMETLSYVEGAAISLAAGLYSASDVAAAQAINDEMRQSLADFDPVRFTALNEAFHRRLTDVCANQVLGDVIDTCWKRLARLRQSTFSFVPNRAGPAIDEHEAILGLIEKGADPRRIELAVRAHRLATPDAYLHRTQPKP
ncbi:GntR family transcriptional regulator [Agrococcus sp. Marseille-Q4369]|uniref:GntR family transcriptional regulator n=1 Tax=Agrococcus sp. Marseille-Q4369 TaxID=2810513 RepID=UPI001B8B96D7|nr:GntR family transcriptional regulator [Agrococcus sp. Marseille-Q4369]QUW18703.1 GntR family transcriptional regulator [Agrococcus sp. Marseille-Q4369]